jgi:hypothetical protein
MASQVVLLRGAVVRMVESCWKMTNDFPAVETLHACTHNRVDGRPLRALLTGAISVE